MSENKKVEKNAINIYGEDHAHITENYPYGFRLRTERKEWIESKKDKKGNLVGQRFVTQTKNPKNGQWNAPKPSTYCDIMVGIVQYDNEIEKDTISYNCLRMNDKEDHVKQFEDKYKDFILPEQKEKMKDIIAWDRAMSKVTWKVTSSTEIDNEPHQTMQEQANMLGKLAYIEKRKMESEK